MNTSHPSQAVRALQRSETPYVLLPEDVATHFCIGSAEATTAIKLGLFGPWFLIHGKPAILRDTLREHLRLRMAQRAESDKELLPSAAAADPSNPDHPRGQAA